MRSGSMWLHELWYNCKLWHGSKCSESFVQHICWSYSILDLLSGDPAHASSCIIFWVLPCPRRYSPPSSSSVWPLAPTPALAFGSISLCVSHSSHSSSCFFPDSSSPQLHPARLECRATTHHCWVTIVIQHIGWWWTARTCFGARHDVLF
jgi:hypothetical protein